MSADKDSSEAMAQLATATATPQEVELNNGDLIVVRPLKFMQTVNTLRLLPPLLDVLKKLKEEASVEEIGLQDLLQLAPDAAVAIACMCIDKRRDFFDTLETDEGIKILTAVWEVNQDFFKGKVQPLLQKAGLAGVLARVQQVGLNASISSSKPGTASPM